MLGCAIAFVKLIYNFIAESFIVMVVTQKLLRCKERALSDVLPRHLDPRRQRMGYLSHLVLHSF